MDDHRMEVPPKVNEAETETAGRAQARVHRHTLIEMNRAVFTARRDAAFARLRYLTREVQPKGKRQSRVRFYNVCSKLVQDALMATRRSQIQDGGVLLHYFKLLQETVRAQLALLTHETMLAQESREFLRLVGQKTITELRAATAAFSTGEKNVFHAIGDLLDIGEPILNRDTIQRRGEFSEDERRRYEVALREFNDFYSSLYDGEF